MHLSSLLSSMDTVTVPLLTSFLSSSSLFLPTLHALVLQALDSYLSSLLASDQKHALLVIAACFQDCPFLLEDIAEYVFDSLCSTLTTASSPITLFHTLTQLCIPQSSFLQRFKSTVFAQAVTLLCQFGLFTQPSASLNTHAQQVKWFKSEEGQTVVVLVEFVHQFIETAGSPFAARLISSYFTVFDDFPQLALLRSPQLPFLVLLVLSLRPRAEARGVRQRRRLRHLPQRQTDGQRGDSALVAHEGAEAV